jgi:hypothetical protein
VSLTDEGDGLFLLDSLDLRSAIFPSSISKHAAPALARRTIHILDSFFDWRCVPTTLHLEEDLPVEEEGEGVVMPPLLVAGG